MASPPSSAHRAVAAQVDSRWVILDLARDRYLLAPTPSEQPPLVAGRTPALEPLAQSWIARGSRWPQGRASASAALQSLLCLHRVASTLRRRPFEALVEDIRTSQVRAGGARTSPEALLAGFEAARPFHTSARVCRLDAPATVLLMRRHGHPAGLVFGVRLEPFAAHCWAELDGAVLNEAVDAIAPFTPILVA